MLIRGHQRSAEVMRAWSHLASDGGGSPVSSARSRLAPLSPLNLLSISKSKQRWRNKKKSVIMLVCLSSPRAAWRCWRPAPWPAAPCCPGWWSAAPGRHGTGTWSPCPRDTGWHSGYSSELPHSLETFNKLINSILSQFLENLLVCLYHMTGK